MTTRYIERFTTGVYSQSDGYTGSSPVLTYFKSQGGANTPNFRFRKGSGPLPANDYGVTVFELTLGTKRTDSYSKNADESWTHDWTLDTSMQMQYVDSDPDLEIEVRAKLASKLLSQVKDMKVNIAQASAEAGRTANLFASTARRLTLAITSIRKRDLVGAAQALGTTVKPVKFNRWKARYDREFDMDKVIASGWLELQYGWKPLLQDVYGAAETLAREHGERPIYQKISVSANGSTKRPYSESTSGIYFFRNENRNTTTVVKGKSGVMFEVTNSPMKLLSSIGLTDPALLAWELLPYSFVIDWFLPIGNWLSNVNATSGVSFLRGYTSIKITTESTHAIESSTTDETVRGNFSLSGGKLKITTFRRAATFDFPINPLPTFKNPVSFQHATNALALLQVAFGGKKP